MYHRTPPLPVAIVPANHFINSPTQQRRQKKCQPTNQRIHRNLSRKNVWLKSRTVARSKNTRRIAAKNTSIKVELPRDFKERLQRSAEHTIVLDGVKVPLILRQLAGLGPKFVFPNEPYSNNEDIIGLTIAMRIVSDSAPDSKTTKRMFARYLQAVEEHYKDKNRRKPAKIITTDADRIDRYLCMQHKTCIRFLRQHPDIIITESDKGHKTIISSKTALVKKRQDFIDQQVQDGVYSTFAKSQHLTWEQATDEKRRLLAKAKTAEFACLIRSLNQIFKKDRANGLQVPKYGEIKPQAYQMARMVVAMKAHKGVAFPIRPIIAAPDAMGADLEAYILRRLERIYAPASSSPPADSSNTAARMAEYRFIARDSLQVHSELHQHHFPTNHQAYTVDFANMYTNINIGAALSIIEAKYDEAIAPTTSMPKSMFLHALRKTLQINEHFSAGMRIYRQAKGLPMGGKLSYALSEIVTSEGLRAAVDKASSNGIEISYIAKYVDDILLIINGRDLQPNGERNMDTFKKLLGNHIVGMPITHEEEEDCGDFFEIKYLNMAILRRKTPQPNKSYISTRWTMQSYATGRIINAWSAHTTIAKTTAVKEQLRTAIKVTSAEHQMAAISLNCKILQNNGYRTKMIMLSLREVCGDENVDFEAAKVYLDNSQDQRGIDEADNCSGLVPRESNNNVEYHYSDCLRPNDIAKDVAIDPVPHQDNSMTTSHQSPSKPPKRRRRVKCSICRATLHTWTNETAHVACIVGRTLAGDPLQKQCSNFTSSPALLTKCTSVAVNLANRKIPSAVNDPAYQREMMSQPAPESDTQVPGRQLFTSQLPTKPKTVAPGSTSINQPSRPTTAVTATQTIPTKGRAPPAPLPTHTRKPACNFDFVNPRQFDYISAPYIQQLTEITQKIITSEGLTCKLMHRQPMNKLFTPLKDKIPEIEKSMVTFAVTCHTCGLDLYFNAIDAPVGEVISKLKSNVAPTNADHVIEWKAPKTIRAHSTVNKANIALSIYRGTISDEPGNPHRFSTNIFSETISNIMKKSHANANPREREHQIDDTN